MADLKISQLNEATTPLTTDFFPIVNQGETKKLTLNTFNNFLPITTTVQSNSASWSGGGGVSTVVQDISAYSAPSEDFIIETNAPLEVLNILNSRFENISKLPKKISFSYLNQNQTLSTYEFEGNCSTGNFLFLGDNNLIDYYFALSGTANYPFYYSVKNLNVLKGGIVSFAIYPFLSSLNFPDLEVAGGITFYGSTPSSIIPNYTLKEINFPKLKLFKKYSDITGIGGYGWLYFQMSGPTQELEKINFPELLYVDDSILIGGYGLNDYPKLREVNFPKLKGILGISGNITIGGYGSSTVYSQFLSLTSINFNSLESINTNITFSNMPNLSTIDLPSLKYVKNGVINLWGNLNSLTGVNLNSLQYIIGGYGISTSSFGAFNNTEKLSSISMPNLKHFSSPSFASISFSTSNNGLRNFELGTNTLDVFNGTSFTCNQTLTQVSVDNLLKAFARLDGSAGRSVFGTNKVLSLAGNNSVPSYTGGVTTTSDGTNFVRTGNIVVASVSNHGHSNGDIVTFTGNGESALNGTYTITVNNINEFQYTTTSSGNVTGSGTVTMRRTTVATDGFRYFQIIALRGASVTINMP